MESIADKLENSTTVVRGKVTEIRDSTFLWQGERERLRIVTLVVSANWKAKEVPHRMYVVTGVGGTCDFQFVLDREFIVFATNTVALTNYVSACSPTKAVENAARDLKELGKARGSITRGSD
jgi:hypothetical protein